MEQSISINIFKKSAEAFILKMHGAELMELYHTYTDVNANIFDRLNQFCDVFDIDKSNFLKNFGSTVIHCFYRDYHAYFAPYDSLLDFLRTVQPVIHKEVKRVHSHANPPEIILDSLSKKHHVLVYRSEKNLPDLVHGMLEGLSEIYNTPIEIFNIAQNDQNSAYEFTFKLK